MYVHVGELRVLADAVCAVDLNGFVDNLERHPRSRHLDHGDVRFGGLINRLSNGMGF